MKYRICFPSSRHGSISLASISFCRINFFLIHLFLTVGMVTDGYGDEPSHREHEETLEAIQQELAEVEELIEEAEEHGQGRRLHELAREQEVLIHRLEHLDRMIGHHHGEDAEHEAWDEERKREWNEARRREWNEAREGWKELERTQHHRELEHHAFEIEIHTLELKLQKSRLELELMRQEAAVRLAQLAENPNAIAVMAIQKVAESAEHPEHAAEVLMGVLERTRHPAARRVVQLHLAQLLMHADQVDRARDVLAQLINSPDRHDPDRPNRRRSEGREREMDRERDRDMDREREGDEDLRRHAARLFSQRDKDRNETVTFDEWMATEIEKGGVTEEAVERQKRLFGEIAGDDGQVNFREFFRWMASRRPDRER